MVAARSIPIVILFGQSNANSDAIITATFGRVAAAGGLLVQSAVNGSPLSTRIGSSGENWAASTATDQGKLLQSLIAQVTAMIDPNSPSYVPGAYVESAIWIHGGADIFNQRAAQEYEANLAAVHRAMTTAFGTHEMVISGMADASLANRDLSASQVENWRLVQSGQEHLARIDPNISNIDPDVIAQRGSFSADDMFGRDYIHYSDSQGYATALGRALANAAVSTLSSNALVSSNNLSYRTGTTGNDIFTWGGQNSAQILGRNGTDTLQISPTPENLSLFTSGINGLRVFAPGNTQMLDAISIERVSLSYGHDIVHMGGSLHWVYTDAGRDRVKGSAEADTILLGTGADIARGSAGDDTMMGGYGNDTLLGEAGADVLYGDAGNNRYRGGGGVDQFVFSSTAGTDTVVDFTHGVDKLKFTGQHMSDLQIKYVNGTAIIDLDDRHVILLGQSPGSLTTADFLF